MSIINVSSLADLRVDDVIHSVNTDGTVQVERAEQGVLRDFWVDGHFIVARDEADARAEARALFGNYEAETVRLWRPEDNNEEDPA